MAMKKNNLPVFCCLAIISFFLDSGYAYDVSLMDKFAESDWICNGAQIAYNYTTREIKISKVPLRFKPDWARAKLDLGKINVSDLQNNTLSFDIEDLNGQYSLTIRYGGSDQYDTHSISIQDKTFFTGACRYNISQTLRNKGLEGEQQIQLEFMIYDDPDLPADAAMVIQNLIFVYDDALLPP